MPRTRKLQKIDNTYLSKSLDRLVSDILELNKSLSDTMSQVFELARLHGVSETYLEGYLWGRLVVLAREGVSRASVTGASVPETACKP